MTTPRAPSSIEPLEPRTLFALPGDTLPNISDTGTDAAGNVYRAGTFTGTVDFNPAANATFDLTAQSTDNYVARFAPDGRLLWAVRLGAAQPTGVPRIGVAPDGTVYVAADFATTFDADPSPNSTVTLVPNGTNRNLYLIRLDQSGVFRRLNAFATPGQDMTATDVAVTPAQNVVLVANSQVPGISDPDDQKGDGHFYLLNARLRTLAQNHWGSTTSVGVVETRSVGVGPTGAVYIAGASPADVDFAPDARVRTVTGPMRDNPFLLRLDPAGAFSWITGYEFAPGAPPTILIDNVAGDDSVEVSGTYSGTVDFNASPRRHFNLTPANGTDGTYSAIFSSNGALIFAQDTTALT